MKFKPALTLGSLALVLGLSLASAQSSREAKRPSAAAQEEVDHIALAAMLVRDGHDDRAQLVLSQVELTKPGLDLKRYYSLRGVLALKGQRYQEAIDAFDHAIQHGQSDDMVFVYLAQCYYGLQDWERVILSVKNADQAGRQFPELALMRAQAEQRTDRLAQSWKTLDEARAAHPEHLELLRQQTFTLIKLGLYQAAAQTGEQLFAKMEAPLAADYIALALAFHEGGQAAMARQLLERGRLRFPDDEALLLHLAHSYRDAGMPLAAGELLQLGSERHEALKLESAELFRQARAQERALYMNAQSLDQAQKFKQLATLLIDAQAFEQLAALSPRFERLGLLEEQSVIYAVAYAQFKVGQHQRAEALLKRIHDPTLFEYATQLRRLIALCERDATMCGG